LVLWANCPFGTQGKKVEVGRFLPKVKWNKRTTRNLDFQDQPKQRIYSFLQGKCGSGLIFSNTMKLTAQIGGNDKKISARNRHCKCSFLTGNPEPW